MNTIATETILSRFSKRHSGSEKEDVLHLYIVAENDTCKGCAFEGQICCPVKNRHIYECFGECSASNRKDGKSVIFRELDLSEVKL